MALDFDEVTAATIDLISVAFLELRRIVRPTGVYRYDDWVNPPLSKEEYLRTIFQVTSSSQWAKRLEPMPGAIAGIHQLLALDVEIEIVTARGEHEGEIEVVEFFLAKHGLELPIIGTAGKPKSGFLNGHVIALDDREHELAGMPPEVHRLLFPRPHNQAAWQDPEGGIVPICDWPHAVETTRTLLGL